MSDDLDQIDGGDAAFLRSRTRPLPLGGTQRLRLVDLFCRLGQD